MSHSTTWLLFLVTVVPFAIAVDIKINDKYCVHVYDKANASSLLPFVGQYEFKKRPVNERPKYQMKKCKGEADCDTYSLTLMTNGFFARQWRLTSASSYLNCHAHRYLSRFNCTEWNPKGFKIIAQHKFKDPVPRIVECGQTITVDNGLEIDGEWALTVGNIAGYIVSAIIGLIFLCGFCMDGEQETEFETRQREQYELEQRQDRINDALHEQHLLQEEISRIEREIELES